MKKYICPTCGTKTTVTTTRKREFRGKDMRLRYHTCPTCGKTYTILWMDDEPNLLWVAHKRTSVADKVKEVLS